MKVVGLLYCWAATVMIGRIDGYVVENPPSMIVESRLTLWSESAVQFVREANCDEATFTSSAECRKVSQRDQALMNIYAAYRTSSAGRRFFAVLPDGSLAKQGPFDAILTLDPYPEASFGHLVLIFLIDYNTQPMDCQSKQGIHLNNGDCMVLARKIRCRNLVERQELPFNRRCEIDFLPLVSVEGAAASQLDQQLQCFPVSGFAECPERRSKNETSKIICNPADSNRHRCRLNDEMTLHRRCRVLETCDHALILAGGWNRDHSAPRTALDVARFYHTLRTNGFHRHNVRVFYANGAHAADLLGDDVSVVYPSVMKLAFRYHLQKICQSPLCADSLVIYLNSPVTIDGHMLLWDIDANGQMDASETYSLRELSADLRDCSARQVYVLVDQSYAGRVVNHFSRSKRHNRLIVMGSGSDEEYSHNGEFTAFWTSHVQQNMRKCVTQLQQESERELRLSRPTFHDGTGGSVRSTLSGAPCDVRPPFSREELRNSYFGCQNVPTSVWLSRFVASAPAADDDTR